MGAGFIQAEMVAQDVRRAHYYSENGAKLLIALPSWPEGVDAKAPVARRAGRRSYADQTTAKVRGGGLMWRGFETRP